MISHAQQLVIVGAAVPVSVWYWRARQTALARWLPYVAMTALMWVAWPDFGGPLLSGLAASAWPGGTLGWVAGTALGWFCILSVVIGVPEFLERQFRAVLETVEDAPTGTQWTTVDLPEGGNPYRPEPGLAELARHAVKPPAADMTLSPVARSAPDRLARWVGYQLRLLPHRPRLWWQRLWLRKDEFHSSLEIDVAAMMAMNPKDQQRYLEELTRRRVRAHERDLAAYGADHGGEAERRTIAKLTAENQRLRAIGAGYSGARETQARAQLLRLQAALTQYRLGGDVSALDDAARHAEEFLRTPVLPEPAMVTTPRLRWSAAWGQRPGHNGQAVDCAVIHDDDFAHDAKLYVSGDFGSPEDGLAYAAEVAAVLNAAGTPSRSEGVASPQDTTCPEQPVRRWPGAVYCP